MGLSLCALALKMVQYYDRVAGSLRLALVLFDRTLELTQIQMPSWLLKNLDEALGSLLKDVLLEIE